MTVNVGEYTRRDGTKVKKHSRSDPDFPDLKFSKKDIVDSPPNKWTHKKKKEKSFSSMMKSPKSKALEEAREEYEGLFNEPAPKNMSAKEIKDFIKYNNEQSEAKPLKKIRLIRFGFMEGGQTPLSWIHRSHSEDELDIIVTVLTLADTGDVRMRISSPKGRQEIGFVGADPANVMKKEKEYKESAKRYLKEIGYDVQ